MEGGLSWSGGVCHGGVGWGGMGCVMEGWGGSYTEQLGYRGQPSLSTHYTTWSLLKITGRPKFNYNHTPNYLELLREQIFNYNHTL